MSYSFTSGMSSIQSSCHKKSKTFKLCVVSIKQFILPTIFVLFVIGLVLFSSSNLPAAKNGLILWATAVVPSLFPFFVATELLSNTNVVSFLGKALHRVMRPLFNIPGEGAFAFLMGLISGYPVGAKVVTKLLEDGLCTKEEAERMLSFTNNSGPLFIIGTVGISLFGNTTIGILLFVTHLLACVSVGIIFNIFWSPKKTNHKNTLVSKTPKTMSSLSFSSLGDVLGKSIKNSISTILMIGGFVVIFSVVISIGNSSHLFDTVSNALSPIFSFFKIDSNFVKPVVSGIIELTNGIGLVSAINVKEISTNIILSAFLLGFGGISIFLQVFSIVSPSHLSIKKYFFGKLLQGILASFYTYFALQFIPFLHFNL